MPTNEFKAGSNENWKSADECDAQRDEVIGLLTNFYAVMGHAPEEDGALAEMARILVTEHSVEEIKQALDRCDECEFPVRLGHILTRMPVAAAARETVEAQAAWRAVEQHLRTWGVDGAPIYERGKWIRAPAFPARIEYALRQVGGLWRVNQITDESYPFVYRDFCAAYNLAPAAELMTVELLAKGFVAPLLSESAQLAGETGAEGVKKQWHEKPPAPPVVAKPVPEPLTVEQERDRREMLKQQAQTMAKRLEGQYRVATTE